MFFGDYVDSDYDDSNSNSDYDDDDDDEIEDEFYDSYDNDSEALDNSVQSNQDESNHMKRCMTICDRLNEQRKGNVLCDATVVVEGRKFPVHKNILTASSSYFSAMFTGSFSETHEKQIEIKGVSAEVFQSILDYVYGLPLALTAQNIKDISIAGDMLCLDSLIEECKTYIRSYWETITNLHTLYELVQIFQMNDIAHTMLLEARHNMGNFMGKNEFRELPYSFFLSLFEDSTTWHLMNESKIANYILQWAIFKPEERIPEISSKVFSAIHFEYLSKEEFSALIAKIQAEENPENCKYLVSLKESLCEMYEKSHKRLRDQNFMLVIPENKDSSNNLNVFNCKSWKWKVLPIPTSETPEAYILNDNFLYIFNTKGCSRLDLLRKVFVTLPDFPVARKNSVFSVVGKVVYVIGGVRESTNKPMGDILHLKRNKKSWHRGTWNGLWKKAKCKASSAAHNQCIYLVGSRNSLNRSRCSSKCFVYNCETRKLKKICEFSMSVCQPHVAIHNGILYVVSNEHMTKIQRVDLQLQELLPTNNVRELYYLYPIIGICSVDEGIVIAYSCNEKILLTLFRPTGPTEVLGFVSKPSSWPDETPFQNFNLLFYKLPAIQSENDIII